MLADNSIKRLMEKEVMYSLLITATSGGFYKTIRPKNDAEEEVIKSLVDLGFSVGTIKRQIERNDIYRIEWCNRITTFKPAPALMLSISISELIDRIILYKEIGKNYRTLITQLPKVVKSIICSCVGVNDIYSAFEDKKIREVTIADLFHAICD